MLKVLSCIAGQHDLRLVLIAALTCVTASFTAFRLYAQGLGRPFAERAPWVVFTALTAGAGVWATHFIAMLAYAPVVKSGYDLQGTVGSLLLSILGAGFGFGLATFVRRKLWMAAAGLIAGLSIGIMHFVGMAAFHPSARVIWDQGYVVASLLIGAGFGAAAVSMAGRTLKSIALASGLYTVAVAGLHFTAMSAVTLLPDPRIVVPPHFISNGALAGGVAGAASLIFLLAGSLVTLEGWSRRSAISHLKDAIEPMAEGIAYFDPDDRIIVWNSRYAELVDPAGVLAAGMSFRDLLLENVSAGAHPEAQGQEAAWVEARLANRNQLGSDEHRNGERWVRAERRRTRDGGLVTVVMDVTDFHWANQVLAQARDAAEAANRAKSEFLANISHELRTPLNGVLGIAEVLTQTELNAAQREMVETIRSSGASLEALLGDIMDLARLESGNVDVVVEPFDLGATIRTVAAPFLLQARTKGVGLSIDMGAGVQGAVAGDAAKLRQILANLISNAVKFTDAGEVRIAVDRPDPSGAWIRFSIKDTGVGFTAETKDRIFDHFHQADGSNTRRHGGTGLGLAICKQAAELLGGFLDCDSVPGQGSEFVLRLELPAAGAAPGVKEPASRPPQAPAAAETAVALGPLMQDNDEPQALRVLVVDDHPTNRRVVEMILDQVGAERVSVENGKEALEAYLHDHFDVVLMDIQMPVMDGLTATQKIRLVEKQEHRTPTPVIILSANAMPEHIAAGRAAGADRHLAKPISAAELLTVIAEVAGDPRAA